MGPGSTRCKPAATPREGGDAIYVNMAPQTLRTGMNMLLRCTTKKKSKRRCSRQASNRYLSPETHKLILPRGINPESELRSTHRKFLRPRHIKLAARCQYVYGALH